LACRACQDLLVHQEIKVLLEIMVSMVSLVNRVQEDLQEMMEMLDNLGSKVYLVPEECRARKESVV